MYLPGPLTRELFYVRLDIVNSVAAGCVHTDGLETLASVT